MAQEKNKQTNSDKNLVDKVGETNIYPVSEMEGASDEAEVHAEASLGRREDVGKDSAKSGAANEQDSNSEEK